MSASAHPVRPSRRPAAARSLAGFTLLEIMLAVAILGIILVMLAGSFHAIAGGKVQAENRLAVNDEGRAIMTELCGEIRGSVQTPLIASRVLLMGEASMNNNAPLDSLTISTLDPGHRRSIEGFGAEDTISYTAAPNPDHAGWFLLLRSQYSSLLGIGTGGDAMAPVVMASNLLSLHVRYFDGNSWNEGWNSQSLPPGRQLPTAVSIDLVLAGPKGKPLPLSSSVTLPMAFQQW
jgi:prepilin-type N-terminal cleavage/methylation domain-containing protein